MIQHKSIRPLDWEPSQSFCEPIKHRRTCFINGLPKHTGWWKSRRHVVVALLLVSVQKNFALLTKLGCSIYFKMPSQEAETLEDGDRTTVDGCLTTSQQSCNFQTLQRRQARGLVKFKQLSSFRALFTGPRFVWQCWEQRAKQTNGVWLSS